MASSALSLNFFVVPHSDTALPFLIRSLQPGEVLRHEEIGWYPGGVWTGAPPEFAVHVGTAAAKADYAVEEHSLDEAGPAAVELLLMEGLATALTKAGRIVERDKLAIDCYRPDEVLSQKVPQFVVLRRGVEMRPDHFTHTGEKLFGFFVSTRARLRFRIGLDDALLADAALGQVVHTRGTGGLVSGILTAVDAAKATAALEIEENKSMVPIGEVEVPASPLIVGRYCRSLKQPVLARQIHRAAQEANYRLLPNGQRNPRWIAARMDQARSWLISASQYERLSFRWPNSDRELYLQTKPLEMYEAE